MNGKRLCSLPQFCLAFFRLFVQFTAAGFPSIFCWKNLCNCFFWSRILCFSFVPHNKHAPTNSTATYQATSQFHSHNVFFVVWLLYLRSYAVYPLQMRSTSCGEFLSSGCLSSLSSRKHGHAIILSVVEYSSDLIDNSPCTLYKHVHDGWKRSVLYLHYDKIN